MNEICIDIETIPQQGLSNELTEIANQKIAKKREGNNDFVKFCSLDPHFGEICCIGIGIGINVATIAAVPEKEILEAFWRIMEQRALYPRFITFNGKNFDFPFIIKRSAINGIMPTVRIVTRKYDTQFHFDCMEVLADFSSSFDKMVSLRNACKIYGIPNDDNSSGGDIYGLFMKGQIKEIEKHCAADVKATMQLYEKLKHYF
jgi:predicted PolB exonuclease-like 3'-5' exonuclease